MLTKETRERFSTARHNLGYYRCVAITARYYREDPNPGDLLTAVENALAKVILRHPPLCCGIINEDKNDPAFVRLESIDVSKCLNYRVLESSTPEKYEKSLIEIVEHQHGQLWPDLHCRPGWKLIVVQDKKMRKVFDAVFAFHHAVADGLSGMVFHRSFMEALNGSAAVTLVDHILRIPDSIKLLPPMEEMIDFKISWRYLLSTIWNQLLKPKWLFPDPSPPWAAAICSPTNVQNYRSHAKLISIPENHVTTILGACREQNTTLTGLLHGLAVTSLASRVPDATSFTAVTPFSTRYLSGISSTEEMAVQYGGHISKQTPDIISAVRAFSDPAQIIEQVWKIAKNFKVEMAAETTKMPNDNLVGMIPYVSSIHNMYLSKMGKPRDNAYEVSNVGSLKNEDEEAQWKVGRVVFTQSGNATGAAFAFNVASVVGGPLTISVTWLEGDVEEKLVGDVLEDVQYALGCIADGKEVSLGHSN